MAGLMSEGTDGAAERGELVRRPRRKRVSRQTPEERSEQARIAALSRWQGKDAVARAAETQAARDGLEAKWASAPNPEAAKALHMSRMRLAALSKQRRTR
jgi:hypothetical protein